MSSVALLGRLAVSMTVVIGVMWLAARLMRKRTGLAPARPGGKDLIQILGRKGLGKSSSVAVVNAAGRTLVLGVTDAAVSLLAEVDDPSPPEAVPPAGAEPSAAAQFPQVWKQVVETMRDRTVRR